MKGICQSCGGETELTEKGLCKDCSASMDKDNDEVME